METNKKKMTRKKGVPKGFQHNWAYHGKWKEKKTAPGKWTFTFRATKGKKARYIKGAPGKGFKVGWRIKAKQYVIKTGRGKYQTYMKGRKQLIKAEKTKNIAILTAVMLIAAILGMLAWKCGGVSCLLH